MKKELDMLELLRKRSIKDANDYHLKHDVRMEEICFARADAYKNAIDIINGKLVMQGAFMTEKEKNNLDKLLDKLYEEKCEIEIGISSSCSIDCPFYINGAYGGACAISIVSENITY